MFRSFAFWKVQKQVSSTSISRFMVGGRDFEMLPTSHLSISRAKVIGFLLAIIFQISAIVPTSKWDAIGKWTSWQLMISLLILAFQKWHQIGHLPCNPKYVGEVTVWHGGWISGELSITRLAGKFGHHLFLLVFLSQGKIQNYTKSPWRKHCFLQWKPLTSETHIVKHGHPAIRVWLHNSSRRSFGAICFCKSCVQLWRCNVKFKSIARIVNIQSKTAKRMPYQNLPRDNNRRKPHQLNHFFGSKHIFLVKGQACWYPRTLKDRPWVARTMKLMLAWSVDFATSCSKE